MKKKITKKEIRERLERQALEIISAEIKKLDELTGEHGSEIPIRLTKAWSNLGTYINENVYNEKTKEVVRVTEFQFSRKYFTNPESAPEVMVEVIKQAYAHYLNEIWYESYATHDTWKKCCMEIHVHYLKNFLWRDKYFNDKRAEAKKQENIKEKDNNTNVENNYKPNDRIEDPIQGAGTIISIDNYRAYSSTRVRFDSEVEYDIALTWAINNFKKIA